MKVKVSDINDKDLKKLFDFNMRAAKSIFRARPFVTKLWFKMNTKLSHKFIDDNWGEITNLDN